MSMKQHLIERIAFHKEIIWKEQLALWAAEDAGNLYMVAQHQQAINAHWAMVIGLEQQAKEEA